MDKEHVITTLEEFKGRLTGEVVNAFIERGASFGDQRFAAWRKKFTAFLSKNFPNQVSVVNEKLDLSVVSISFDDSDLTVFWRQSGDAMEALIDSLIIDIKNDEFDLSEVVEKIGTPDPEQMTDRTKVFIVHGHDGETKQKTARFIEKLGFQAIILHEQASRGKTIIEKIEDYSDVGFAIVLYTPDDSGNTKSEAESGNLRGRARQNVVFEHGFLISKIGRSNVVPLVSGDVELPNDISGMVYVSADQWQVDIAKEMKAAGYEVDFNKIL